MTAGSAKRIEESPIKEMVITDTIEHRFEPLGKKIKTVSVAPLFAQAIDSVFRQTSVSKLFE